MSFDRTDDVGKRTTDVFRLKNRVLGSDVDMCVPGLSSMPGLKTCLVERTALRQRVWRGSPKPGCAVLTLHHHQKMIASLLWGKLTDLLAPDALKVFVTASLGKGHREAAEGQSY